MKTKTQKSEELTKGRELMSKAHTVLLVDFSKVGTADLKNLRQELKKDGNPLLVIKKTLLGLLLKEKGIEFGGEDFKVPMGAVFAGNLETAASSVYKFYRGLEIAKKINPPVGGTPKILGGYDLSAKSFVPSERIVFIGKLPPREVVLAQLLGMLAAPIRSFLYVLSERSKKTA